MCGLVGAIGLDKSYINNVGFVKDFITNGLYISALRGTHGSGIGAVEKDMEFYETYKSAFPANHFIESAPYRYIHDHIGIYIYVLGHVRASTRGEVSAINAHPFISGPILLAHNGTISNTWDLEKKYIKHGRFPVDSELVAACLSKVPSDDAKSVLEEIEGSYVLTWMDQRDKSFNIARNKDRPLWGATFKNKKTLVYISELEMLDLLTRHCRDGDNVEDIFEFKPGIQYKWTTDGNYKEIEFTPKVPASQTIYNYYNRWSGLKEVNDPLKRSTNLPLISGSIIGEETGLTEDDMSMNKLVRITGLSWTENGVKKELCGKKWFSFDFKEYTSSKGIIGKVRGIADTYVIVNIADTNGLTIGKNSKYIGQVRQVFSKQHRDDSTNTTKNIYFIYATKVRDDNGKYTPTESGNGLMTLSKERQSNSSSSDDATSFCDFCNTPAKKQDLVRLQDHELCENCIKQFDGAQALN